MKVSRATTSNNKKRMIQALILSDSCVLRACKSINIHTSTHYRWLQKDKHYVRALDNAIKKEERRLDRIHKLWKDRFDNDYTQMLSSLFKN